MELFNNLIYEYEKGMRDLALYTCNNNKTKTYISNLKKRQQNYAVLPMGNKKTNIFFGDKQCLEILKNFSSRKLNQISPQEDFILGIMLGYSRKEQYSRLLRNNS